MFISAIAACNINADSRSNRSESSILESLFLSCQLAIAESKSFSILFEPIFESNFSVFKAKSTPLPLIRSAINLIFLGEVGELFNLAKKNGYANVTNIKGDSNDLKIKMKPFLQQNIRILHPTSKVKNSDLENFFRSEGCYYKQISCYKSIMINQKAEVFENFFKSCKDGLITLFSRRTAISFKKELSKLSLMQNHRGKKILTLSDSIAEEIKELKFDKVFVCSQPNERGMLKLIRQVCKKEKLIE